MTRRHCIVSGCLAATATLVAGFITAPAHARVGPPPPDCPADLDGNLVVDFSDLLAVLAAYEQSADGDVDGDGDTDFNDLLGVLAAFGPCPTGGPAIFDFQPRAAAAGEIVEIFGQGFGEDGENLCLGGDGIGFRVLQATDQHLRAVLLPFDPALVQPGPIGVAIGQGVRRIPGPNFELPEGLALEEPIWCWTQPPNGPVAVGPFTFTPVAGQPGATEVFQSQLIDGDLVIDLMDVSWQPGDKIRIVARAWCDLYKIDCTLPTMRLLAASPTPEQCAVAICLLIKQAYQQLGEFIDCTVEPGPRIRLSYPDCDIQPGISLSSMIARTACPLVGGEPLELIDVITAGPLEEGDVLSIVGQGFDSPLNDCVMFPSGCSATPLTVIGDRLIVRVGPVPPGAQPGPIMVARGRGTIVQPNQFFVPGINILGATDGFQGNAGFPDDFVIDVPVPPGQPSSDTWRFVFNPETRSLVLDLEGDWEPGDFIRVDVHFDVTFEDGTVRHFDCFAEDVQIPPTADPDPNACAQAICAIISQTFANQNPPVDVECNVNGATITVRTPALGQLKGGGGTVRRIPG